MRPRIASLTLCAVLLTGCGAVFWSRPAAAAAEPDPRPDFERAVLPYLETHCIRCHGPKVQESDLRIDALSRDFAGGDSADDWLEVIERIHSGEMPPDDVAERPPAAESARVATWLATRIEEGTATRQARQQAVGLFRLSREEYANTVQDLLGVGFDVGGRGNLVADERWQGFERIGAELSLSPAHVEKYLAAAERILAEAYPPEPPRSERIRSRATELAGGAAAYGEDTLAALRSDGRLDRVRLDLWPGQSVTVQPPGGWLRSAGTYRIRVRVSGLRGPDGRAPHLEIRAATVDRLLSARDSTAPEDAPEIIEFEAHLPRGPQEFTVTNEAPGPLILSRIGRRGRPFFDLGSGQVPWQVPVRGESGASRYPLLILDWIEWEGPIVRGVAARARYLPAAGEGPEGMRRGLQLFAEQAFRRPLRRGELDRLSAVAEREVLAGADRRSAALAAMQAILCSVDFLYLVEGPPGRIGTGIDDWELASRLSYFLWSTMPDAELFRLARAGRLRDPAVLRRQVLRMLADPRARRFADSFPRQWLQLQRVGMFPPDRELYPEYDGSLERSMVRETTGFFAEVLARNLGLREFLDSDWTVVDERLARHYGLATSPAAGDGLAVTRLAPGDHRGGILTHASVLSLTSDGTRHRPVHRGVWFLQSILGETPPPPPANVDPIEPVPVLGRKSSFRERLAAHRSDPTCAACHRRIDPHGLAFESYDAIGRWRTVERMQTGVGPPPPVDSSGTLPDGRTFDDSRGFRRLLLGDLDRFARAFTAKLATFALRRRMTVHDRGALRRIAAATEAGGYRLRDLLVELVCSDLFRRR